MKYYGRKREGNVKGKAKGMSTSFDLLSRRRSQVDFFRRRFLSVWEVVRNKTACSDNRSSLKWRSLGGCEDEWLHLV